MAILSKEEYREFTIRVSELTEQGYDLASYCRTFRR